MSHADGRETPDTTIYTMRVSEQSDGSYVATEPTVDRTGHGDTPPAAIIEYTQQYLPDGDADG